MTYEVRMTANAENNLRGIFEYIAFNLQSVENAVRQLDRLEHNIASLEQMPERFPVFREEPWRSRNLRIMPAMEEARCISRDPDVKGYTSIDELQKALEE